MKKALLLAAVALLVSAAVGGGSYGVETRQAAESLLRACLISYGASAPRAAVEAADVLRALAPAQPFAPAAGYAPVQAFGSAAALYGSAAAGLLPAGRLIPARLAVSELSGFAASASVFSQQAAPVRPVPPPVLPCAAGLLLFAVLLRLPAARGRVSLARQPPIAAAV